MVVTAIACLPAALVATAHTGHNMFAALNPLTLVRAAVRMDQEYLLTILLLLVMGFLTGGFYLLVSGVPVAGKLLTAAVLALMVPMAGLALGRLLARSAHAFT
jgi:hypothetical protein